MNRHKACNAGFVQGDLEFWASVAQLRLHKETLPREKQNRKEKEKNVIPYPHSRAQAASLIRTCVCLCVRNEPVLLRALSLQTPLLSASRLAVLYFPSLVSLKLVRERALSSLGF